MVSGNSEPTAVVGPAAPAAAGPPNVRWIPVDAIEPGPYQPRHTPTPEQLAALAESIATHGIIEPLIVRPAGGGFELIAGERRWRAAKRAGLQVIPAIVKTVSDLGRVEQALIENLHRQDLNPLEEAGAYQQLIEDFGLTHEQLSARVGKSRTAITNTLRLFQLPPAVQKLVSDGQLSAGHARALLGTPDRSFQESLARRAVAEEMSVRAVEDAVKERNSFGGAATERTARQSKLRPPGILELEELLSSHLDTRVKVELGNKRGRVTIDFASLEDLERIYRAMTEPPAAG